MKILNFSILFAASLLEVLGKEQKLECSRLALDNSIQNSLLRIIFRAPLSSSLSIKADPYMRRPKKKKIAWKKPDMMPQRFCTHQNCRNCHQGLTSKTFETHSAAVRVCKLLLVSPKCCYDYMFNNGYSF